MSKFLTILLFNLLSKIPLSWVHILGGWLGKISYLSSHTYARRLHNNLRLAYPSLDENAFQSLLHNNITESGKAMLELPWIWLRPLDQVLNKITHLSGWEHVEAAQAQNKGIIFLTPHLACFETIGLYVGAHLPMTCMYRVPRRIWLDGTIRRGRERGKAKLARADIGGVRTLYKALRKGETIGILPDQVPSNGEGEWVPFFGKPAYTMTLATRLLEASQASVIMCTTKRLPKGKGYAIHFAPLTFDHNTSITLQINQAVEIAIQTCPEQYLWSYNRYKIPSGVTPPKESL